MPLKILHTADVHLGAKFLGLGKKGRVQRARLLRAFERTVDLAISEKVDLFIIAGDLFDSTPVSKPLVAEAAAGLERLSEAHIPICLTPGTHDPFGPESIYNAPELAGVEGLTVFKSEEMKPVVFPELSCAVHGSANMKPFRNMNPLDSLELAEGALFNVGIIHATFEIPDIVEEDTYMVTPGQIASSGLDYLALGHLHGMSDRSSGGVTAYYSGSPEMIRMQKSGAGFALLVELGEGEPVVTPLKTGALSFEELNVEAEEIGSAGLMSTIKGLADADRFLQINVVGLRPPGYPDPEEIVEELADEFFIVKVNDKSSATPEALDPSAYPRSSLAAGYLRAMENRLQAAPEPEREEIREAMLVGLSLLLEEES